eukprot:TRINITY_DN654_c1_g1_i1.p1 TRINITY_DN654_c1_g1~~TRINITY_DN654_c1_g1_i1.p1  ORF type:complete len:308 (-),score=18.30 TRINITY_DN654_c1_g1_i1:503-1426(-)
MQPLRVARCLSHRCRAVLTSRSTVAAAAAAGCCAAHTAASISSRGMATKTKAKKPDNEKLTHSVATAIAMVQANARAQRRNFVESLELALVLGVDPRKPNQAVRGAVTLPHGTGKEVRVAVFARGAEAEAALAAGASRVGAEDLMEDIMAGKIDFERLIATPDMMPLVGRVARVLGPRGLMPNPKLGTITKDTAPAVRASKGGQVSGRVAAHLLHGTGRCVSGRFCRTPRPMLMRYDCIVVLRSMRRTWHPVKGWRVSNAGPGSCAAVASPERCRLRHTHHAAMHLHGVRSGLVFNCCSALYSRSLS